MRLIAHFTDEKLAYKFHYFLLQEGIQNSYDTALDPTSSQKSYNVWIINEEDMPAATEWLKQYEQNPSDPKFQKEVTKKPPPFSEYTKRNVKIEKREIRKKNPLTIFVIVLCSLLFLINSTQQSKLEKEYGNISLQLGVTNLQRDMLFDYPHYLEDMENFYRQHTIRSIEEIKNLPPEAQVEYHKIVDEPTWKGVSELITTRSLKLWDDLPPGSFFGKIRMGQFWRLFTPCLMHNGLFHILFNMCWVWVLGRQIEGKIGKLRMICLILITGVIANISQYIMGGPIFEGFSGVVVGFVGFIWMRQKVAPWEGYPLQRSVILFIAIYVFAMLGLEILSFALQYFQVVELVLPIANTAHIVGGLAGVLCARLSFFSRGLRQ